MYTCSRPPQLFMRDQGTTCLPTDTTYAALVAPSRWVPRNKTSTKDKEVGHATTLTRDGGT